MRSVSHAQKPELVVQIGHYPSVNSAVFSGDGKWLISNDRSSVKTWDTASGRLLKTFTSGSWTNGCASYTLNGNTVATASYSTIKLWDIGTGQELRTLVHPGHVSALVFSPDGKTLASSSSDEVLVRLRKNNTVRLDLTIKLWDTTTGQLLQTLVHSEHVWSMIFSPDGKTLVSGSRDGTLALWEVASGKLLRTLQDPLSESRDSIRSLAFSPDGKWLSSDTGSTSSLWDMVSCQEVPTLIGMPKAFSSRSRWLAYYIPDWNVSVTIPSFTTPSGTIKLWDLATGQEVRDFSGYCAQVSSMTFSPYDKILVTGSVDNTIKLWDTSTGELLKTLTGHAREVTSVMFSRDGKRLVSGSSDSTIKLWDVVSGQLLETFTGHSEYARSPQFSPDGKWLASVGRSDIQLWNIANGQSVQTLSKGSAPLVFSPDSKWLVSTTQDFKDRDTTFKLWDVASGQLLKTFGRNAEHVRSIAFSPTDKTLAVSADDPGNPLQLWDIATGELLRTFTDVPADVQFPGSVNGSVVFSPDGKWLASDRELKKSKSQFGVVRVIKLWDIASGQVLKTFTGESGSTDLVSIFSIAFSPDGKWLAAGGDDRQLLRRPGKTRVAWTDHTIKLWDVSTGQLLRTLRGHANMVSSVSFSPDSKQLVCASDDGIKLWDVASGQLLRSLSDHSQSSGSVVFSPDGKWLASDSNRTLKLWDSTQGQEVANLFALGESEWLVVTPEGRFDTNNLEQFQGAHWVVPDDPFTPVPIEIFMSQYYEPRLLSRLLSGESELIPDNVYC